MRLFVFARHSDNLGLFIKDLYATGRLCDVKIVCRDSEVLWAHRVILGSASPFLKSILAQQEDEIATLLLPHVGSSDMRLVLDYIYGGAILIAAGRMSIVVRVIEILQLSAGLSMADDGSPKGADGKINSENERNSAEEFPIDDDPAEEGEDEGGGSAENACVMCGRLFRHAENLKMHLQRHLGNNVRLKHCSSCKRVFRSEMEHELHMNSHRYWSNFRLKKKTVNRKIPLCSLLRIKLLRKYVLLDRKRNEKRKAVSPVRDATPPPPPMPPPETRKLKLKIKRSDHETSNTWCDICHKFFMNKKKYNKHVKKSHSVKKPSKPKTNKPSSSPRAPPRPSETDLTCPTCDKTFIASSIFQRHLKTSRHGSYKESPVRVQSLPHLNPVVQPTVKVGGVDIPKYECHLCNQVFIRVKDLAKHRTKMCTAYRLV